MYINLFRGDLRDGPQEKRMITHEPRNYCVSIVIVSETCEIPIFVLRSCGIIKFVEQIVIRIGN